MTNVRAALQADHRIQTSGIRVSAQDGHVTLSGTVGSEGEKVAAVESAFGAQGVQGVTDRLQVSPRGHVMRDRKLQSQIEAALGRDPAFRAEDEVTVGVSNGIADLGGIVDSWADHHAATQDALNSGARKVINHLRVRQDPGGSMRAFVYSTTRTRGAG